ncbi:hypothetical protein [Candidatus Coxiella mudrowiae]|uniref:hypothetical protein n=1 Tax=Candidatus Coxiella mudrowiae TaxID=2054173 RepID=UPI001FD3FAD2|nr:hypothetical protein [Candidatus Coxiella mudrowiae]
MRVLALLNIYNKQRKLNLEINIELKATVSDAEKLVKQLALGLKAYTGRIIF